MLWWGCARDKGARWANPWVPFLVMVGIVGLCSSPQIVCMSTSGAGGVDQSLGNWIVHLGAGHSGWSEPILRPLLGAPGCWHWWMEQIHFQVPRQHTYVLVAVHMCWEGVFRPPWWFVQASAVVGREDQSPGPWAVPSGIGVRGSGQGKLALWTQMTHAATGSSGHGWGKHVLSPQMLRTGGQGTGWSPGSWMTCTHTGSSGQHRPLLRILQWCVPVQVQQVGQANPQTQEWCEQAPAWSHNLRKVLVAGNTETKRSSL